MRPLAPRLAAALLALALAACGPAAEAPGGGGAAAAGDVAAPERPGEAWLEADGFVPANPGGGGRGRKLAFGDEEAAVIAAMTRLRGGQAPTRSANAECPAGPLTFADWGDGLQLVFSEGRFAGWLAGEGAPAGFRTRSGIAVGTRWTQVRAAAPGAVRLEATLGPEFAAGEVYGLLSGPGEDAVVTVLWAGLACMFR